MSNKPNPLVGYFRTPKLYVSLPSQGRFYSTDIIDWPESGELAVYAMTAKDEVVMKNPDALLNGEAVCQVLTSCVPGIHQPKKLLSTDVDTLLVAIQAATQGDEVDVSATCPKCKNKMDLKASVSSMMDRMETMQDEYAVSLDNGLVIGIQPYTYAHTIKSGIAEFKSSRSLKSIADIKDEMEQLSVFNTNFQQIAVLNFELLIESVLYIKTPDGETVSDKNSIQEFLENCDGAIGKKISEEAKRVNSVGIPSKVTIVCTNDECKHEFETEVNFDPVNFSTAS
jgi:hypothetical protein